jgi:branched-chain amino acid transport system ATP-binding protein
MLLEVERVTAGYGEKTVLHDVSMTVGEHEVVAVLGHNGAGKSTLLATIYGVLPVTSGRLRFETGDITAFKSSSRLSLGMGYSPQGAPVFPTLSVRDNLLMGGFTVPTDQVEKRVEKVEALFPSLRERNAVRAGSLSGGERQMLALGMLLVAAPRLVLLDEPSGGLSPAMVDRTYSAISEIAAELSASVLLVEQDVDQALRIASRVYVLSNGRTRFEGTPDEIKGQDARSRLLIGY